MQHILIPNEKWLDSDRSIVLENLSPLNRSWLTSMNLLAHSAFHLCLLFALMHTKLLMSVEVCC
jgi:hypothetical protein